MKSLRKIYYTILLSIFASTSMPMDQIQENISLNSTYNSLAELKEKASKHDIKFIHGLSEFTYSKMNPETLDFFTKHGNLFDEYLTPAPHVIMKGDFAIDTKSKIYKSRFGAVLFGQNIETKELLALKPALHDLGGIKTIDLAEVNWLKELGRFRGMIDHFEEADDLCLIAMNLFDGLNGFEASKIYEKVNHHAHYLIAYNMINCIQNWAELGIRQCDVFDSNFMICPFNFNVEIIDFDWVERIKPKSLEGYGHYKGRLYLCKDIIRDLIKKFSTLDNIIKREGVHSILNKTLATLNDSKKNETKGIDSLELVMNNLTNVLSEILNNGEMDLKSTPIADYKSKRFKYGNLPHFSTSLITGVFSHDRLSDNLSQIINDLKKYQHGTFEELLKYIEKANVEGRNKIDLQDLNKVVSKLNP